MNENTKRRKRQPTAQVMREQLALAAEEIIQLRLLLDSLGVVAWRVSIPISISRRTPWWRRLFAKRKQAA